MLTKKWVAIALLASATLSTAALADDRGINTALGAAVGAVIGNGVSGGGQGATLVGGILGAVVGANLSSHDDRQYRGRSQAYRTPTYYRQEPVRAQPRYRYRNRNREVERRDYRDYRHDYREPRRVEYVSYDRRSYRR